MYNVDTVSLTMNFNRYKKRKIRKYIRISKNKRFKIVRKRRKQKKKKLDWNYIYRMQCKITKQLVLYAKDKKNRDCEIKYNRLSNENKDILNRLRKNGNRKQKTIYWHGQYDGYIFNYNENWHSLIIMLPNYKVENYTKYEIKDKVNSVIMEYFGLELQELNELVLNRLDVHCDYDYGEGEDYDIILNILDKAPEKIYGYKKIIQKNDKNGYILKYLAVSKKKYAEELITIENNLIRVEKGNKDYEKNE